MEQYGQAIGGTQKSVQANYANGIGTATPMAVIPSRLQQLDEAIDRMHLDLAELLRKIGPIMVELPETNQKDSCGQPRASASKIAYGLDDLKAKIETANRAIAISISRIEL